MVCSDSPLAVGRGLLPSYCQVEIEVQVYSLASTAIAVGKGEGSHFCLPVPEMRFPAHPVVSMTPHSGWPCYYWLTVKVLSLHQASSDAISTGSE